MKNNRWNKGLHGGRFKTKPVSMAGKVRVHIPELRMDVYVNPAESIKSVREKYLSQREFENKKTAVL